MAKCFDIDDADGVRLMGESLRRESLDEAKVGATVMEELEDWFFAQCTWHYLYLQSCEEKGKTKWTTQTRSA